MIRNSISTENHEHNNDNKRTRRSHRHLHAASNWFLADLLKAFPPTSSSSALECRIFSVDEIVEHRRRARAEQKGRGDFAYIVNLSQTREAGTHFVLLMKAPKYPDTLFYLDPLRLHQDEHGWIKTFLKEEEEKEATSTLTVRCLKKSLQEDASWLCGFFCLYFIYLGCLPDARLRALGLKPLTSTPESLLQNDCTVLHNLSLVFSSLLPAA